MVAADSASFGYPEIGRGFVPAMVMTILRRSVGEKRAFELVATGRTISASEALTMGLISRAIPDDTFEADLALLLGQLATQRPTAFALTKQLFTGLDERTFEEGILLGARVNALSRATPDFRQAIAAFLKS